MWMGSWETTSQVVKGALESMFGVTEGSMSYGVQGNGRVGRINLSVPQMYLILAENAIDNNLIDDAMDYLDKIRVGRFFPEDYHALKGSVTTKNDAIEMLRKLPMARMYLTSTTSLLLNAGHCSVITKRISAGHSRVRLTR